ncbi:unnamed protein product [Schistocephalus solidus]|uniref:RGS domain-containing protein n=1 Tax=Schistocephalus solidus TaxID=70667 RepID=A0A183T1B2_SCHSO|nr:unnamed protein product [Schistocephalus solidus]
MRRQTGNQSVCATAPSTHQHPRHACGPNSISFRQGFTNVRSDQSMQAMLQARKCQNMSELMITAKQMQPLLDVQRASIAVLFSEMQIFWTPAGKNKRKEFEDLITEFNYDPDGGVNFEIWYRKYALLFEEESSNSDDKGKVEVLFSKSLFNRRYRCFNIECQPNEDYFDLAGRLNDAYHQADLEQTICPQIKALICIKSLTLPEDVDVHTRLLAQLDQKAEMTVQQLAEECVRIMNIKNDTSQPMRVFETIASKPKENTSFARKPKTAGWQGGGWHFVSRKRCNVNAQRDSRVLSCEDRKYLTVSIDVQPARLQVYTTSDLTIIKALGSPELKPTAVRAWASNITQMQFKGVSQATIVFEDKACLTDIYVSKSENDLLGNTTISQLGLWCRPFQEICCAFEGEARKEGRTETFTAEWH